MKKLGMFMCVATALSLAFTSCGDKNNNRPTDLDNIVEDGFYVVGEATVVASTTASNLNLALMGPGTNEVTKKQRDGMYEKYMYLEANKEFSLVLHETGKTDVVYGADLEAKDAITDNDAEVQLIEYWGQLKTNATAKVPVSGLYHIILDLNKAGDLDNMGGAQIVVLPCEWGMRGWKNDWGFRAMEVIETTPTKIVYKYTPADGTDVLDKANERQFKFAHSKCWKFNLDMSGAVKAENSIGTNADADGGSYTELKNGGKNIPVARGIYDYVTLTWELKGGDVAKNFTFETHKSADLEIADPSTFVVGVSGSNLIGQDGKAVAGWSDPEGYALAVYDKDASTIDDATTLAGTYVYNITDLTFGAGSEFKFRYNGEYIGADDSRVNLVGVNNSGSGNFSGVEGAYNIKFTVVWNGSDFTALKAEFSAGKEAEESQDNYVSGKVYVDNQCDITNDIHLYGYGDSDLFGTWPGVAPETDKATIDGVEYLVFSSDKMIANGKYKFILNGGGAQTPDMTEDIVLDANNNAYIRVNADKSITKVK